MIAGEVRVAPGVHEFFGGRECRVLRVLNTGDRPVQVGSHFHFADANSALQFDRVAAEGFRLAVLAGTSVRFEPGVSIDVELVALGGAALVAGLQVRS
jgi:urease subunit beta